MIDLRRDDSQVSCKTRATAWNAGEIIQVKIKQQQDGSSTAEISSKSRWKTVLIDFGRNRTNVERLSASIAKCLDPREP